MRIGRRRLLGFGRRLLDGSNYRALPRFLRVHQHPFRVVVQDVLSLGSYPRTITIRTPTGPVDAELYSSADLSTLNLVFCRQDYYLPENTKVVVDVGSNIGLSSLYWLSRNRDSFVYCFEPAPVSYKRLLRNLRPYDGRFVAECAAVSDFRGSATLGMEPSGVNSSLDRPSDQSVSCRVVHINDVLGPVIERHGAIDVLKMDSEGHEERTLAAIAPEFWPGIRCINLGCHGASAPIPQGYHYSRLASAERFWR